jgi:hypothetical protein
MSLMIYWSFGRRCLRKPEKTFEVTFCIRLWETPSIIEREISKAVMPCNVLIREDIEQSHQVIRLFAFVSLTRSSSEIGREATPWLA